MGIYWAFGISGKPIIDRSALPEHPREGVVDVTARLVIDVHGLDPRKWRVGRRTWTFIYDCVRLTRWELGLRESTSFFLTQEEVSGSRYHYAVSRSGSHLGRAIEEAYES